MTRRVRFKPDKDVLGEDTSDECTPDDRNIYIVKSIEDHRIDLNGEKQYKVKWKGYSERTWEPERNLTIYGNHIVEEYHNNLSKSGENFENSGTLAQTKRTTEGVSKITKGQRLSNVWDWISRQSWDDHIKSIDECEILAEDKWMIYVTWNSGDKTKHDKNIIYKRCPQTMLRYFEEHIIKRCSNTTEGSEQGG